MRTRPYPGEVRRVLSCEEEVAVVMVKAVAEAIAQDPRDCLVECLCGALVPVPHVECMAAGTVVT